MKIGLLIGKVNVAFIESEIVPRIGEVINLDKKDYRVMDVKWDLHAAPINPKEPNAVPEAWIDSAWVLIRVIE